MAKLGIFVQEKNNKVQHILQSPERPENTVEYWIYID